MPLTTAYCLLIVIIIQIMIILLTDAIGYEIIEIKFENEL